MQLRLFDSPATAKIPARADREKLDGESEALLRRYRDARLATGAHPRTVSREVSQVRSLARARGDSMPLVELFAEAGTLAQALLQPAATIAASTGRSRLIACQRFVRECGPAVGIPDAEAFLAGLDELLPARTHREWHSAGLIVAGTKARRCPQGPTLYPADLERIVCEGGSSNGARGRRDRALVALHCYSGLRPDEIVGLRTSQLVADATTEQLTIEMRRTGRLLRLPLVAPAAGPLLQLCFDYSEVEPCHRRAVCVFRRTERHDTPLSSRAARKIVQRACSRAGFPLATAVDLRAAFAYWLKLRGLSDHEAASVLGLKQVKSLDVLLRPHAALDAQRRAREVLAE